MTICIAGITENKKIVAITDKMLTLNAPVTTIFELNENDKAVQLGDTTLGLFAGDVIQANEVLSIARETIEQEEPKTVQDAAKIIVESYKKQWQKIISENLLNRFGLTLEVFMSNHGALDAELVKNITKVLSEFDMGVQIIVAGIDETPHIFSINNPGTLTCHDSIGYHAIGSGAQHANLSLIESQYHRRIDEAKGIYALYLAKKRAEYDPGVGQLCDVVLINDDFRRLENDEIDSLASGYNDTEGKIKELRKDCAQEIYESIYREQE